MKKPPKPSLFYLAGRAKPWGVRIRVEGKYVPAYFATKKERDERAAELMREVIAETKPFTPEQRSWVRIVQSAAKASGISESGISSWLFTALSDRGKKDAAKATQGLTPTSPMLADARAQWLQSIAATNLRPRTLVNYSRFTGFLASELDVETVDAIQRKGLTNWIVNRYQSEVSRGTCRNHIVPFLNWCAEKGWISRDVFARLKWRKVHVDEKSVEWATPEMVTALLRVASEDIRPALALGAFAGVRPEECQRIQWEDIRFPARQIALPGTATKKRRPRLLYDLCDALWLWLDRVPKDQRKGKVFAKSARCWRRHFAQAAKDAGLLPWPQDALRKGFASHAAVLKGRDWTVNIMGHVDERLLDAVYRGAVTKETAERYFSIRPNDEILPIPAARQKRAGEVNPTARD